jgi:exodeoxyribonuclease VII large subunit
MIVDSAEPAGIGALLKLLNERKEKLEKEGLFDASHKKLIPYLPETIGVITSPTGAVIRDIIHRLTDRFPRHVLVWPVAVQGETCAQEVANAVKGFNHLPENFPKPDVLIVARGGGSLEDLWGFNEECVVRAVYESEIPVISAVGHETDTTLIDYVADLRAPTPTGAAEKAVPMRMELLQRVQSSSLRLTSALQRTLSEKQMRLMMAQKGLPNLGDIVCQFTQRLDDKSEKLQTAFQNLFQRCADKVQSIGRLLDSYSYQNVLKRGFVLVSNGQQKIITSKNQAQTQSLLNLQFMDGSVAVVPVKDKKKEKSPNTIQDDLFA